jgi:hypothetical protein
MQEFQLSCQQVAHRGDLPVATAGAPNAWTVNEGARRSGSTPQVAAGISHEMIATAPSLAYIGLPASEKRLGCLTDRGAC